MAISTAKAFGSKISDGKELDLEEVTKMYIDIVLVSVDSINEKLLAQKIIKTGLAQEFFTVAAQLSLIGFGNADYRRYNYKGKTLNVNEFFNKHGFVVGNKLQNNLSEDTLTPRRLIRVFKKQIFQLLTERQDLQSYLFAKYTDQNPRMRAICFAGSEHICDKQDEAEYIYKAYCELDDSLKNQNRQAGISERIKRVFAARGFRVGRVKI